MAAKKQELFHDEPRVPCAANQSCRFHGRLWVRHLLPTERLCVDHYYQALEKDPSLKGVDPVPPKMAGVVAKPVSGD